MQTDPLTPPPADAIAQPVRYAVDDVRALGPNDSAAVLRHLLGLTTDDRRLRFGLPMQDGQIEAYAATLKYERDDVFGIFAPSLPPTETLPYPPTTLVGLAHMAYELVDSAIGEEGAAEIGLSVSADARGRGVGTALFMRAAQRANTRFVRKLKLHYLVENRAMQHIAAKAGMEMHSSAGETDAFLMLRPSQIQSLAAPRPMSAVRPKPHGSEQVEPSKGARQRARKSTAVRRPALIRCGPILRNSRNPSAASAD